MRADSSPDTTALDMPTLYLRAPHASHAIDAVILDLDGTLVDTLGDFTASVNATWADLGLPPVTRTDISLAVGKGSRHLLNTLLALADIRNLATDSVATSEPINPPTDDHPLYPQAWARYQHHYDQLNGQHVRVYDGVLAGLRDLKGQRVPMACVTNKPLRFATALLDQLGLRGYFDHVFGGDSFERCKPDPTPLLRTCEVMQVAPQRTLMVGDSANDAQAARAAGCPLVLLTYGYNHGQDVRAVPALLHLDSLAELATHLSA